MSDCAWYLVCLSFLCFGNIYLNHLTHKRHIKDQKDLIDIIFRILNKEIVVKRED